MNQQSRISTVVPFSLKDAPAFIETQMPVGRVSAEAYKERKAGAGQTLTAIGSYWKGRKPLLLVRACILGCLLPTTGNALVDLQVFLLLMGLDDSSIRKRIKTVAPRNITPEWPNYERLVDNSGEKPRWRPELHRTDRQGMIADWLLTQPYDDRLEFCLRPEEMAEGELLDGIWTRVNDHLGSSAHSMDELIEQLGIMRFGHRPVVADAFCGGGSIPFEAARVGCDAHASDLNPIACTLTLSAFNILGASEEKRAGILEEQGAAAAAVDTEIRRLGIEEDKEGNRAKAYLYCVEARCPKTGWMVPMAPSWIVSKTRNVVARLIADHSKKRYDIDIIVGADDALMEQAKEGTIRNNRLIHPQNPDPNGVAIGVIRGDFRLNGQNQNGLRRWEKSDFMPRDSDIFQERLYCIQWIRASTLDRARPETFFASVSEDDLEKERFIQSELQQNLAQWQNQGLVPETPIEPGEKTDEPIRTRGWTHWHHLFTPRALYTLALFRRQLPANAVPCFLDAVNFSSRLCRWETSPKRVASDGSGRQTGGASDNSKDVFSNQALNPLYNYSSRSSHSLLEEFYPEYPSRGQTDQRKVTVTSNPADQVAHYADMWITDPPYADAVSYHEITEFFISWLQKQPPLELSHWTWSSQRDFAIKGVDERFRADMVAAYRAMAAKMPDNGIQVVMFTHQDAGVWADLASILWAAGLRVSAAWNIVTETTSQLKQGNYVQGTILLVLRKRAQAGNAKRMDIEGEIEDAVDLQLRALNDLSHDWTAERLYTDGDLQLAAYAAALRVITNYETIDRVQVGADVYRKLKKGERTVIRDLIDYAASVANNKLVPNSFPIMMWRDLDKTSRFYIRMLDMESKGSTKFADYQDFAKTFSVSEYTDLMANTKANQASLAGAADLRGGGLTNEFGKQPLRRVLFATYKVMQKGEPKDGLNFLKLEYGADYWPVRTKLIEFARYLAAKTARTRPDESAAADLLMQKIEVDRL